MVRSILIGRDLQKFISLLLITFFFVCVVFLGAGPSPLPRHVDHISVQSGATKVIPINKNQYKPINYTAATRLMRIEIHSDGAIFFGVIGQFVTKRLYIPGRGCLVDLRGQGFLFQEVYRPII